MLMMTACFPFQTATDDGDDDSDQPGPAPCTGARLCGTECGTGTHGEVQRAGGMVGWKCQGSWRGVTDSALYVRDITQWYHSWSYGWLEVSRELERCNRQCSMCKGCSSAVPVQCRLCDQKVVGSVPSRSSREKKLEELWRMFLSSQLFVTLISVSLSPQF